jgi:hypothetical protein
MNNDQATATLIAAVIAAFATIVNLIVSVVAQQKNIKTESRLSIVQDLRQEQRSLLRTQLSEFYDPIFALLSVNKSIFERIGPESDARWDRSYRQEETATVWSELVDEVITPNNSRVCEIVGTRLHLIAPSDTVQPYLEFATHAHAYQVFREQPYEAYDLFRYPSGFLQHVEAQRNNLRRQMDKLLKAEH